MQFLVGVHSNIVPLIYLVGGLAIVWGIVLLVQQRGTDRIMRILLGATAGLGLLQGVLGGILWLRGGRPGDVLHLVYGLIVALLLPVAYAYSGSLAETPLRIKWLGNVSLRRDVLLYTIAVLVLVAAAVRAFSTGAPR